MTKFRRNLQEYKVKEHKDKTKYDRKRDMSCSELVYKFNVEAANNPTMTYSYDYSRKYLVASEHGTLIGTFDTEDEALAVAKKRVQEYDKLTYNVFKKTRSVHIDKPIVVETVK